MVWSGGDPVRERGVHPLDYMIGGVRPMSHTVTRARDSARVAACKPAMGIHITLPEL